MQAHLIVIYTPNSVSEKEVIGACNQGIQRYLKEEGKGKGIGALDWAVGRLESFDLRRQDI